MGRQGSGQRSMARPAEGAGCLRRWHTWDGRFCVRLNMCLLLVRPPPLSHLPCAFCVGLNIFPERVLFRKDTPWPMCVCSEMRGW